MLTYIIISLAIVFFVVMNTSVVPRLGFSLLGRVGVAVVSLAACLGGVTSALQHATRDLADVKAMEVSVTMFVVAVAILSVGLVIITLWLIERFRAWAAAGYTWAFWLEDTSRETGAGQ